MHFRLTPRSMTLNFPGILLGFTDLGGNNGYMNEDRPVLSATEL